MTVIKKEGQGKLFKSPFLEILTKTNPVIHVITYGCFAVFFLYINELNATGTIICLFAGAFAWTFVEYIMHRFLFHIPQSRFQYMIHGVHHEYPRDKERLMMPPLPGLFLVIFFYGLWYLFLDVNTPAFMGGFVAGYIVYTFIHYMIHAWKPIPNLKFLWKHHHQHHNPAYEDKAFGVSSPLWDYIFGSMPKKEEHNR